MSANILAFKHRAQFSLKFDGATRKWRIIKMDGCNSDVVPFDELRDALDWIGDQYLTGGE